MPSKAKKVSDRKVIQRLGLSQQDLDIIDSIEYNENQFSVLLSHVKNYHTYGVGMCELKHNWNAIAALGRDSSSLRAFVLRYGKEEGEKRYEIKCQQSILTFDHLVELHGEEKATNIRKSTGASLQNYIDRHGEEEGTERWQRYLQKRKTAYAKKRKDGYVYAKYNREYFRNLYGIEDGDRIYDQKISKQRYKVSKQRYIDEFGEEMGEKICREVKDTLSLDAYICRHGVEEGTKLYEAFWVERSTISSRFRMCSKWATDACDAIKKEIHDLKFYGKNELVFSSINHPKISQNIVKPDLFYYGKIIEFQGDVFHANPALFESEDTFHPYNKGLTAKQKWDEDAARFDFYREKGYEVLEIWELEWSLDKQGVINKCVTFLKN